MRLAQLESNDTSHFNLVNGLMVNGLMVNGTNLLTTDYANPPRRFYTAPKDSFGEFFGLAWDGIIQHSTFAIQNFLITIPDFVLRHPGSTALAGRAGETSSCARQTGA